MKLIYIFYIYLFLLPFSCWSAPISPPTPPANYTTPTLTNNTTLNTPQTFQVQVNFKQANSEQCQILALTKFVSEVSKFGIDATSQIVGGLLSAADSVVNSTVGTVGSTVGSVVKGLGLKERATNQYVGAANYANDMEWICQIGMGTPAQQFLVSFDTGSADLWVPCKDCDDCTNKRLFDYTKSSTMDYVNGDFSICYVDGSCCYGYEEQDTCQVGNMNIYNQQFAVIEDMSSQFVNDPIDGVMGLGYDSLSVYQGGAQTTFTNMYNQGLIPSKIFSVQLRPARSQTSYGGIFVFGGIDPKLYSGSITYAPVTTQNFYQIGIDDIECNGKVVASYSSSKKQQAIVDTGTALLIVTQSVAKSVHQLIGGKYDSSSQTWQVPCSLSSSTKLSLKISGVSLAINYQELVREQVSTGSSWCYSGIASTTGTMWILGGTFLKDYYVIFDQKSNRVGFATPVYAY